MSLIMCEQENIKMGIDKNNQHMKIVVVGHVDHGKSTLIGRLLADTDSLPKGKLVQVRQRCIQNGKSFEYAFLSDALKDEQSKGITIDSARCFFQTKKRHYIIFDAPGHVEFLKNMVTGAANAEAALVVIDAHKGIQENSKRHGYLLSLLGIKQICIVVNKMDMVDYSEEVFENIVKEYNCFLKGLNIKAPVFIPISALNGEGLAFMANKMKWYKGETVLKQLDLFEKETENQSKPLRFPIQDCYEIKDKGHNTKVYVGTIETGDVNVGDNVVLYPSKKEAIVQTIEEFNVANKHSAKAGQSTAFTLKTPVEIEPGELMVKRNEPKPHISSIFKANIFWMGKKPFIKGKTYKIKILSKRTDIELISILNIIDTTQLKPVTKKDQVDCNEVAEVLLKAKTPIAFDHICEIENTSRFVLVDGYEIASGGVIFEKSNDENEI